jgi:SprT-like family
MNGKHLRSLFAKFNEQYFDNRVPAYSIRVVRPLARSSRQGRCIKRRRLIEIVSGLPDSEAISILLHEMAHAATKDNHGMAWKREMIRLREAAAPLVGVDLGVRLDDWDGLRVNKMHFQSIAEDILAETSDAGLTGIRVRHAIRWYIHSYGGAESVAAFLRKCPWAPRVFAAAKKNRRREIELRNTFRARRVAAASSATG